MSSPCPSRGAALLRWSPHFGGGAAGGDDGAIAGGGGGGGGGGGEAISSTRPSALLPSTAPSLSGAYSGKCGEKTSDLSQMIELTRRSQWARMASSEAECAAGCANASACVSVAWHRPRPLVSNGVTSQCWPSATCTAATCAREACRGEFTTRYRLLGGYQVMLS